jgi:tetratricopeptide (TPR) repeat protein
VKPVSPIDPVEFVTLLQPLLRTQDAQGIISLVRSRWSTEQLTTLFRSDNPDVRKVAALVFGLVGKKCFLPDLAALLKDQDAMVNQMAEHSMWSVWFTSGNPQANHELCRGSKALNRRDYEHALHHFNRAAELDSGFAEAYNQRAIVHYLREDYESCIGDCLKALERMPCHFGAWAGLGHCHAHEGRLAEALRCYEEALKINPHLEGVRQGVAEMRAKARGEDAQ